MPQPSKEPCKKNACDIQACLSKNNFDSRNVVRSKVEILELSGTGTLKFMFGRLLKRREPYIPFLLGQTHHQVRCLKAIELLQSCCEKCSYNSTHCASVSDLLKQSRRQT
ncbi:hypothetical protein RHMOL_Rhmol11G0186300 [Rhododendron molle]|uniref:Uncharacterized protein n=1 Tax=Rhododendron molle TaxID=49168 RepID=A0ACC0LTY6_RHOML|nr:hypothetical protein RHMOL_Rhmol11G0186300 [Rhododendron molle]